MFKKWLSKVNKLGYQRATRSFYAELSSKNLSREQVRPIRNKNGSLSTSLSECLNYWRSYYQDLYKCPVELLNFNPKKNSSLNDRDRQTLNKEISREEGILAVDSLKDYSSPGTDQILNRDLTILLHQGENSQPDKDGVNIMHFIHGIFRKFWREEQVPPQLKCSIIVPFLF